MVAPVTGHKMKAYRNTGTYATPVWSEVDEIGDLSVSELSLNMGELKRRAKNFTKTLPGTFNPFGIEFRLHYGLDATNYDAIRAAFFAQTVEEWAFMNGDIATSDNEGLRCPCSIEQFPWDQPIDDVAGHDVRLTLAYFKSGVSEVDPTWYTVP